MGRSLNEHQINILVSEMRRNRQIANGRHSACTKSERNAFWDRITEKLNNVGPPTKTHYEWRQAWIDKKNYVNKKAARLRQMGNDDNLNTLLQGEQIILDLMNTGHSAEREKVKYDTNLENEISEDVQLIPKEDEDTILLQSSEDNIFLSETENISDPIFTSNEKDCDILVMRRSKEKPIKENEIDAIGNEASRDACCLLLEKEKGMMDSKWHEHENEKGERVEEIQPKNISKRDHKYKRPVKKCGFGENIWKSDVDIERQKQSDRNILSKNITIQKKLLNEIQKTRISSLSQQKKIAKGIKTINLTLDKIVHQHYLDAEEKRRHNQEMEKLRIVELELKNKELEIKLEKIRVLQAQSQ